MTWCSLAVAATLVVPHIGGESHEWLNGLYCAAIILFVYPAIVAAGAGSELKGETNNSHLQMAWHDFISALYHSLSYDLCTR